MPLTPRDTSPRPSPAPPSLSASMSSRPGGIPGLTIGGFVGSFNVINGSYSIVSTHNNHPCWKHDDAEVPCTIFHTGVSRWVISRDLDDGETCFAFIAAEPGSISPTRCPGCWTFFDSVRQQWAEDPLIRCTETSSVDPPVDPFARVKAILRDELDKVGITSDQRCATLWRRCDASGHGFCDLQVIDGLIRDLAMTRVWPGFYDCSIDILTKAYEQVIPGAIDADTQVDKTQFPSVLGSVYWFAKIHDDFSAVLAVRPPGAGVATGTGGTRICRNCGNHLQDDSFYCRKCGTKWEDPEEPLAEGELCKAELRTFDWCMPLSDHEVDVLWRQIDKALLGKVKLHDFCIAMYQRLGRAEADRWEALSLAGLPLSVASTMEAEGGALHQMAKKKTLDDFDQLEKQIKRICFTPRDKMFQKMWELCCCGLEHHHAGSTSLSYVEKMIAEVFPLLSYKPALLQAFRDTTGRTPGKSGIDPQSGVRVCNNCGNELKDDSLFCRKCGSKVEDDAILEKEEMKKYLHTAFYYSKFFWLFNIAGVDARMDFQHFHFYSTLSGDKLMSSASRAEFNNLDKISDGQAPFEAFCAYFAAKQCLLSGVTL